MSEGASRCEVPCRRAQKALCLLCPAGAMSTGVVRVRDGLSD